MKTVSSKLFVFPFFFLIISTHLLASPDPTNHKTFKNRIEFEATAPWTKLSESFDGYVSGDRITYLFDSLLFLADAPMAVAGMWDYYGTGGSFKDLGLLPLPAFENKTLNIEFSEPVFGFGTNVFDDFDGAPLYNKVTLTVTTSYGEVFSVTEDSSGYGDCGFLGATSSDGIVSVTISIDGAEANLEVDLLSVLLEQPCTDSDGDGICDNADSCPTTPNTDQADGDCDGIGNVCDRCSGGNDGSDADGDGVPDCADWEGISSLPEAWKCGSKSDKVTMCHNGSSLCVSPSAVSSKLSQGDFLGPCDASGCGSSLEGAPVELDLEMQAVKDETPVLDVFPNPTQGDFNVALSSQVLYDSYFVVSDAQGKVVLQQKVIPNQLSYRVSVASLPKGMYLVKIFEGGKETSKQDLILM